MSRNLAFGTALRTAINLTAVHSQHNVIFIENELGKSLGTHEQQKPYEYVRWLAKGNLPHKPRKMTKETLVAKCCERLLQLSNFQLPLDNIQAILLAAECSELQDWLLQRLPRHQESHAANQDFQLPNVSPHFLAEDLPIQELSENLQRYRILYITGLGGVGKTELALYLAHQNRAQFDQVLCYVHDNRSAEMKHPEDFLAILWSMIGQKRNPNWDMAQSLKQLRLRLSQQRYLILIDNLELESASSLLAELLASLADAASFIVTSRVLKPPANGYVYPLASMRPNQARQLLLNEASRLGKLALISADSNWINAVLELANGHPKTLIFLSHYLLMQPGAFDELFSSKAQRPFESLFNELFQDIYGKVWQTLDAETQSLMRLMLLVSDTGIQYESLLIMSQLSTERFRECAQELNSYCFLETVSMNGKAYYKLHPLTRHYLQTFIFPDARTSNNTLYRQFIWAQRYIEDSSSDIDSMESFIPQFLSFITEALLRREELDEATNRVLLELIQKLHPILTFSEAWSRWEHILALLSQSERLNSQDWFAAQYLLAELWYSSGRWQESFSLLQKLLTVPEKPAYWLAKASLILADISRLRWEKQAGTEILAQILKDWEAESKPAIDAARLFVLVLHRELLMMGDNEARWQETLDEAIAQYQSLPQQSLEAVYEFYSILLLRRAAFRLNRGDFELAEQDYLLARKLAQEQKNIFQVLNVDGKLGVYYWLRGRLAEAESVLVEVVEKSKKLKSYGHLTFDTGNLALVYLTAGELDLAESHFEEQYQLALRMNIASEMSRAKANHAFLHLCRAQSHPQMLQQALVDLDYDRFYTAEYGTVREHVLSLINLAYVYLCLGKAPQSQRLLSQAETLAKQSQLPILLGLACRVAALASNEATEKRAYLEQALTLFPEDRLLDHAACYLALCQLDFEPEQRQYYWQLAHEKLETMGALAWLRARDVSNPPQLPFLF